jgi:hypothetical protein
MERDREASMNGANTPLTSTNVQPDPASGAQTGLMAKAADDFGRSVFADSWKPWIRLNVSFLMLLTASYLGAVQLPIGMVR